MSLDCFAIRFLNKKHLIEAIEQIFTDNKMIRAKDVELVFEKFGDFYDLETQTVRAGYNGWSDSMQAENLDENVEIE